MKSQKHSAFGLICAAPVSNSNPSALFGTSSMSGKVVLLTICRASMQSLGDPDDSDTLPVSEERVLELEMTPLQFAQFISLRGEVPCTIRWQEGKGDMPAIPEETDRFTQLRKRLERRAEELTANCEKLVESARKLQNKASVTKAERAQYTEMADSLVSELRTGIPYMLKHFIDCAEEIKAEVKCAESAGSAVECFHPRNGPV